MYFECIDNKITGLFKLNIIWYIYQTSNIMERSWIWWITVRARYSSILRSLFEQFTYFTNLFLLFQEHLLVLLHEVFLTLELLVVIRIRIVYFLFNLDRARPLEVGVTHAVEVRVHHCVFSRDTEVRIELKHVCKQLDCLWVCSLK